MHDGASDSNDNPPCGGGLERGGGGGPGCVWVCPVQSLLKLWCEMPHRKQVRTSFVMTTRTCERMGTLHAPGVIHAPYQSAVSTYHGRR